MRHGRGGEAGEAGAGSRHGSRQARSAGDLHAALGLQLAETLLPQLLLARPPPLLLGPRVRLRQLILHLSGAVRSACRRPAAALTAAPKRPQRPGPASEGRRSGRPREMGAHV